MKGRTDYPELRAALNTPAVPPEKPKRKWRKVLGYGCAIYLWLAIAAGIYKAVTEPDVPPAPATTDAAAVAAPAPLVPDTVAAPPPTALATPAPEVATPVQEAPPPAKQQKSITVYTTRTGDKYHRSGCSSLRKSRNPTTLSEAQSMGYDPCGRCKPPR